MKLETLHLEASQHGRVEISHDTVELIADGKTDWFFNPSDGSRLSNVIRLTQEVDHEVFSLSARISVDFASPYDAGALFIECDEENWAKVAFEYSAERKPTIVSVVTRTTSDDADGPSYHGDQVWLRLYCDGKIVAAHFSENGRYWHFLRFFTLPGIRQRPVRIGLGAQSPTGEGTRVVMSDVRLSPIRIENLRNGE
ncbi:DUF1349 domain-containing protein [Labrys sp. KNU-23]|uniref:DUF1349 domain-containing protein n=1 Tax=Labrys sp. KNU-23 TaxID=2789216 RepID=UPI0011EEF26D|nr:DUF1349 domain-containing protein [Labrys sp. KNU-23]QEN84864.1 DUF1349 domain-containing protein [Labrys sp. KNU-23]